MDRAQAEFRIAVLAEDRPNELAEAYEDALSQGPRWRELIDASLERMPGQENGLLTWPEVRTSSGLAHDSPIRQLSLQTDRRNNDGSLHAPRLPGNRRDKLKPAIRTFCNGADNGQSQPASL